MNTLTDSLLNSNSSEKYYYVRITGPALDIVKRMSLPISIGSSGLCDILVCSESMPHCAYILHERNGNLLLYHIPTKRHCPLSTLQNFGIRPFGPLNCRYATNNIMRFFTEFLHFEKRFFNSWPLSLRKFAGEDLGAYRLPLWLSVFLAITVVISTWSLDSPSYDQSKIPFNIRFGEIYHRTIGASHMRKGYENGVTFKVKHFPMLTADHEIQLYFEAVGLRHDKELSVFINDALVYHTDAKPHCVLEFCQHYVAIPIKALNADTTLVYIKHNFPNSPYFIRNVYLRNTPVLGESERIRVERWLNAAENALEGASVTSDNLVTAKSNAERAIDLLKSRAENLHLIARTESLLDDINTSWNRTISDLWTRVDVAIELDRIQLAQSHLQHLLRLFPDPSVAEHQKALNLLSQIREQRL